jgi:outer membrane protein OmpA-like peptidoglycan-associated protein
VHVLRQVTIPDLPDEDVKMVLPDNKPKKLIAIPDDKPTVDEVHVMPTAPEATAPVVQEKVKMDLSGFDALAKVEATSMGTLEKQLSGVAGSLVDKSVKSSRPVITVPASNKPGEGGLGSAAGIPGRQSLDEALGKVGGPVSGRPVAMKGGALFQWGKADLLPDAILDLQKLGELIKRNPSATFVISGHTDHTGTHEGNLILSQQRADAVRYWIVSNLGIDPARITTIGKADEEAFPELGPDKSIDEQAPNRRVEIVIKTHRK